MHILLALLGLLLFPISATATQINMCPLDLQQYTPISGQCDAPDTCEFDGIRVGLINDPNSTAPPQTMIGVNMNSTASVSGPQSLMLGFNAVQALSTGNTCTQMGGVLSFITVNNSSTATTVVHFQATESKSIGATLTDSTGFQYQPAPGAISKTTLLSADGAAKFKHAGPARIGAAGDPTTGYDLDIEGPTLLTDTVRIGPPTATPTPTVTPTATSATPTTTGASATPTPSPTSTPPLLDVNLRELHRQPVVMRDTTTWETSAGSGGATMTNGGAFTTIGNILLNFFGAQSILKVFGQLDFGTVSANAINFVTNNTSRGRINGVGQLELSGGTALTNTNISLCGTSPSIGTLSYDNTGTVTVGTLATSCTITFGTAFAQIPRCFANDRTTVLPVRAVPTTSTVVFDTAVAANISSGVIDWWCVGKY